MKKGINMGLLDNLKRALVERGTEVVLEMDRTRGYENGSQGLPPRPWSTKKDPLRHEAYMEGYNTGRQNYLHSLRSRLK